MRTNYTDEFLPSAACSRLGIDPKKMEMGWVMDLAAQALRNIVIGLGGKMDGSHHPVRLHGYRGFRDHGHPGHGIRPEGFA